MSKPIPPPNRIVKDHPPMGAALLGFVLGAAVLFFFFILGELAKH